VSRKIYYWINDTANNLVSDGDWEEVSRLQHWYNSEFFWTAGKINFKMFSIFPNWDYLSKDKTLIIDKIKSRKRALKQFGLTENQIIRTLAAEGLLIVKMGGNRDRCIASGFTRVASNEYNAYLVCEFLLKASIIVSRVRIEIQDEGKFIKPQSVSIQNGNVIIGARDASNDYTLKELVEQRRIFSVVNPGKYDDYTKFSNQIENYSNLKKVDKLKILHDWNWLGFEDSYDIDGNDHEGLNLNLKVGELLLD
jgi:hypothetical protein